MPLAALLARAAIEKCRTDDRSETAGIETTGRLFNEVIRTSGVYSLAGMDQNRAPIISRPCAVLDIFDAGDDEFRPGSLY